METKIKLNPFTIFSALFLVGLLFFSLGLHIPIPAEAQFNTCPSGAVRETIPDPNNPGAVVSTCCPPGQLEEGRTGDGRGCQLVNPATGQLVDKSTFGELGQLIVRILLGVAGVVAVVFLIVGGFQYVVSRGNEEEMTRAKGTVQGAIIGIVVILLSFAVVAIINNLLFNPPG